ncbi:ABC transporter permease [Humidisolicoccus flavus]|uniref:ABC transporter permease n=1 Tax=Humidisolicoccus flavus TaxID=3111414 RepID=UPI00324E8F93
MSTDTATRNTTWKRQTAAKNLRSVGIGAAATGGLLVAWLFFTEWTNIVSPLFLPSPAAVLERIIQFSGEPYQGETFGGHILASVRVVLFGWIVAGLIGLPLGILMGWNERVRQVVSPVFNLLRPIPPIAWIPLAILWFGLGDEARVFVVIVSAVVPWVLNSYEAIAGLDKLLLRAGRTLGASNMRTLMEIAIPTSVPTLVGGARIALGNAWMTIVAAELLGATRGLGFVALNARQTLDADIMVAAMVLIGLLGVLFSEILRFVENRLSRWRQEATV